MVILSVRPSVYPS